MASPPSCLFILTRVSPWEGELWEGELWEGELWEGELPVVLVCGAFYGAF